MAASGTCSRHCWGTSGLSGERKLRNWEAVNTSQQCSCTSKMIKGAAETAAECCQEVLGTDVGQQKARLMSWYSHARAGMNKW